MLYNQETTLEEPKIPADPKKKPNEWPEPGQPETPPRGPEPFRDPSPSETPPPLHEEPVKQPDEFPPPD